MEQNNLHEDLSRQSAEEKSSERGFGITFALVLSIISAVRFYRGSEWEWVAACFSGAVIFLLLAFFWVAPLRPLNNLWHRFGLLLSHIVNPIIMGIVFFSTIFPIGMLMRLFRGDPLKLKLDNKAQTYWQERASSNDALQNMNNQF